MESLILASSCSASPRLPLLSAAARSRGLPGAAPSLPAAASSARRGARRPRLFVAVAAAPRGSRNAYKTRSSRECSAYPFAFSVKQLIIFEGLRAKGFASVSSSTGNENMSTGTSTLPPMPPPSSYIGSPVFWIGVGVALSVAFTTVSSMVKRYAMQQAFKSMMTQSPSNSFGSNSPFPFAMPPQAAPTAPSSYPYSEPKKVTSPQVATVDVSATEVEAAGTSKEADVAETPKPSKKFAFVDVSPEELQQKNLQSSLEMVDVKRDSTDSESKEDTEQKVPTNGAAFKPTEDAARGPTESSNSGPMLSVETIEKMMEDPAVQKMVYPYLPEEMRNPDSFKWMLQNPMYRQQLQDMLKLLWLYCSANIFPGFFILMLLPINRNNMGSSPDQWDNRMLDHLKNFDLSSPEVRQQFAQVGMTPEEVVSKIMANPEVAVAFQNPKIQTAIMDCSQNPLNIVKYQNDKEVMDVFMKISQIFPQING
ncbi:Protein TIC 40, chloroplastic [Dichanthelium oligosanthes]|uniref:Protein TIC 40, chloroplastic n=1 Tax=Dichanthelium oligosanthes TaxID=888268 RepID=A0A1E5V7B0_9POAL|nr:Protein TIC 40, chloroplastic [Dichanthelium oligosanthes]